MPPLSADRLLEMERRVERDPASLLFAPLAEMYRAAGRLLDAERVLRAGLQRHPDHHSAATALGRVLLAQGRHQEAGAVLEAVVASVPDNLLAVRLLGEVAAAGAPRASSPGRSRPVSVPAIAASRAAAGVRPAPSHGDRLLSGTLADLYLEQGDQAQGIAILRELGRREPENPAWRARLLAAERESAPAFSSLGPAPPGRAVPEPLPEEVWITAGEHEGNDPSTLNLVGVLPTAPFPAPPAMAAADPGLIGPVGPATVPPSGGIPSRSAAVGLERLRGYLDRVRRYRTAHAL